MKGCFFFFSSREALFDRGFLGLVEGFRNTTTIIQYNKAVRITDPKNGFLCLLDHRNSSVPKRE